MGKSSMEKLKLLHILKMLNEETDETHRLSVSEIIDRLSDIGIASESALHPAPLNAPSFACWWTLCRLQDLLPRKKAESL